jgi:hypothetical protein
MKHIGTLITDIYDTAKTDWFDDITSRRFNTEVARAFNKESRVPTLRLSQMGKKCPSQLWHSIHSPELEEPTQPWARIKFDYGHILEAYVLALVRASGHRVEGEQDELVLDGVVGHRDCVIDGYVVDVKSANSRSFQKFKDGSLRDNDDFGYLDQLDGYLVASHGDPKVIDNSIGYLLAIDKELGHVQLYRHELREQSIRQRVQDYKAIVGLQAPPKCTCKTELGSYGNVQLAYPATYNPYKYACFPHLRCFLYSNGPRYLTEIKKIPEQPEVDRTGKIIRR